MIHEFFPEEFIALQKELQHHPDIVAKLKNVEQIEAYGIIAAALNILLDGVYDQKDLCRMLIRKLKERGEILVRPDPELIDIQIKESKDSITVEPVLPPSKQEE